MSELKIPLKGNKNLPQPKSLSGKTPKTSNLPLIIRKRPTVNPATATTRHIEPNDPVINADMCELKVDNVFSLSRGDPYAPIICVPSPVPVIYEMISSLPYTDDKATTNKSMPVGNISEVSTRTFVPASNKNNGVKTTLTSNCRSCIVAHDHYLGSFINCECRQKGAAKIRNENATGSIIYSQKIQEFKENLLQNKAPENSIQEYKPIQNEVIEVQPCREENILKQRQQDLSQVKISPQKINTAPLKVLKYPQTTRPALAKSDRCTRCTVIHSRRPTMVKRKRNFRIFSDTPINRWTSVPPAMKELYLNKLLKNSPINAAEASLKVSNPNTSQEINGKIFQNLGNPSVQKNVSEVISGYPIKMEPNDSLVPDRNSPYSQFLVSDVLTKPVTIVTKTMAPMLQWKNSSELGNESTSEIVKVAVGNHDNISNSIADYYKRKNVPNMFAGVSSYVAPSIPIPKEHTSVKPEFRILRNTNGSPELESVFTPRAEYIKYDLLNSKFNFWTYEFGGKAETVVECTSCIDKTVVKVPISYVVNSLGVSHRKQKNMNDSLRKKIERTKLKNRVQTNTIRRLRNKITSLEKELAAPKAYEKFLNADQIEAMEKEKIRGHHWKDDTIKLAHGIRLACTTRGYRHLLNTLKWPLPSIKTLHKRCKSLNLPSPNLLRNVVVKRVGEPYLKARPGFINDGDEEEEEEEEEGDEGDGDKGGMGYGYAYGFGNDNGNYNVECRDLQGNTAQPPKIGNREANEMSVLPDGVTLNFDEITKLLFESEPAETVVANNYVKGVNKRCHGDFQKKVPMKKKKGIKESVSAKIGSNIKTEPISDPSQITYVDSEKNTYLVSEEALINGSLIQEVPGLQSTDNRLVLQTSDGTNISYKGFDEQFQRLLNSNCSFISYSET